MKYLVLNLLLKCWAKVPDERPSMSNLSVTLGRVRVRGINTVPGTLPGSVNCLIFTEPGLSASIPFGNETLSTKDQLPIWPLVSAGSFESVKQSEAWGGRAKDLGRGSHLCQRTTRLVRRKAFSLPEVCIP